MKACEKNRRTIAWLAVGALDAREVAALRAHMTGCEGCRKYFEEVSGVTNKLGAAAPEVDAQTPAHFHRELMERLRAEERVSAWDELLAGLGRTALNWRVAVPAMMVLLLAVLLVLSRRPAAMASSVKAPTAPIASATVVDDPAPTAANYQIAAAQSLSKLDDLLTRQGNESLPPAPVYRASMRLPDNAF
jgi:hypothetical protein